MVSKQTPEISSLVFATIIFAIVTALILAIAKAKGVFSISNQKKNIVTIPPQVVFLSFFTYSIINIFVTPSLAKFFSSIFSLSTAETPNRTAVTLSLFNILNGILIILAFFCISVIFLKKDQLKVLWKKKSTLPAFSYLSDVKIAVIFWLISIPTVVFISNLIELFLKIFFNYSNAPDQLAIEYVKISTAGPLHFIIALISILVFAPLVEEFLFRGLLQNCLKNIFGVKKSIIFTSAIFALFHYAEAQGVSNFTIIISLFVLSLFVGFAYEKQRSLLSPIMLHALFNVANIFTLMFFKDI